MRAAAKWTIRIATWVIMIAIVRAMSQSPFDTPYQQSRRYLIKVSHISQTAVAIGCLNGADPTGNKVGDTLIISCGR